eukprot:1271634-Karenia_brevis.AAC.1
MGTLNKPSIQVHCGQVKDWPMRIQRPKKKCLHCQQAGHDEVHMFYTLPNLATSRHPMIVKAQHLAGGVKRNNFEPACYYLRGVQPELTPPPPGSHIGQ